MKSKPCIYLVNYTLQSHILYQFIYFHQSYQTTHIISSLKNINMLSYLIGSRLIYLSKCMRKKTNPKHVCVYHFGVAITYIYVYEFQLTSNQLCERQALWMALDGWEKCFKWNNQPLHIEICWPCGYWLYLRFSNAIQFARQFCILKNQTTRQTRLNYTKITQLRQLVAFTRCFFEYNNSWNPTQHWRQRTYIYCLGAVMVCEL